MSLFSSSAKSSTTNKTTAIDTAENFENAAAGNLLNLNLAGAKIGAGGKKQSGSSGVSLSVLDNDAIKSAFDFASKISERAGQVFGSTQESFNNALSAVSDANKNASNTADKDNQLWIFAMAAAVLLVYFWSKK